MTEIETVSRTMYKTSDGNEFEDETRAIGHQCILDNQESIDRFCQALEYKDRTKRMITVVLHDYERYKAITPVPEGST